MPFINGRFYINPAAGRAIEAARQAELYNDQGGDGYDDQDEYDYGDDDGYSSSDSDNGQDGGPIQHVEIEAGQQVPSQSGRAQHGFVARVHRSRSAGRGLGKVPAKAETHVFTVAEDLVNFLRNEFAKDGRSGASKNRR